MKIFVRALERGDLQFELFHSRRVAFLHALRQDRQSTVVLQGLLQLGLKGVHGVRDGPRLAGSVRGSK